MLGPKGKGLRAFGTGPISLSQDPQEFRWSNASVVERVRKSATVNAQNAEDGGLGGKGADVDPIGIARVLSLTRTHESQIGSMPS